MRRNNQQSLGELIREFLRNNKLDDKITEARIQVIWEKMMGPDIARLTRAMNLKGSTLTVFLTSSVLRNELSMGKSKILEMLNQELGTTLLQDIRFS